MNTNIDKKIIEIYPVPESYWWEKNDKREISILPIHKWKITEKSIKTPLTWPWWKIKDTDESIFINKNLNILGVKNVSLFLDFILIKTIENSKYEIIFSPIIEPYWKIEYLEPTYICNQSQRIASPALSLCNEIFTDISTYEEKVNSIKNYLGTYNLTFKNNYSIKFDIGTIFKETTSIKSSEDNWFYEYIEIFVGFEEKTNCKSYGGDIFKKYSLLDTIITLSDKLKNLFK